MAIQHRRGNYADFDKSKMVAGEFAVVLQNDPETSDGKSVYIAFNSGSAKRLMTKEDLQEGIEAATQEVVDAITEATAQDVEDAQTAASEAAESASEAASVIPELNQENAVAGTALQLMSSNYTSDSTPYLYRTTGGGVAVGTRELDEIVGGSVGWNQLVQNGNFIDTGGWYLRGVSMSVNNNVATVSNTNGDGDQYASQNIPLVIGHKHLLTFEGQSDNVSTSNAQSLALIYFGAASDYKEFKATTANAWTACSGIFSCETNNYNVIRLRCPTANTSHKYRNVKIHDLTLLLGSTIADYIYGLETATAGSGIAKLKEWGFFTEDYYAYDAGSLQSVTGVSAHIMRDSDDNIIGNYPLDSSVTLRGILKLDSNNKLYFDGDVYPPVGLVARRYGIVDLGTLIWTKRADVASGLFSASLAISSPSEQTQVAICAKYPFYRVVGGAGEAHAVDKTISSYFNGGTIYVYDTAYTEAAAFKTAMSGVYLVYERATPTTEQADPYASVQICAEGGTEEYVTTGIVPVGHNTKYPANLRERLDSIPDLPTTAGTYKLSVTIVSGKPVYQWVTT